VPQADQQIPRALLPDTHQITSRPQPSGKARSENYLNHFNHLAQVSAVATPPGTAPAASITEHMLKPLSNSTSLPL
jgi:hypothetical protein